MPAATPHLTGRWIAAVLLVLVVSMTPTLSSAASPKTKATAKSADVAAKKASAVKLYELGEAEFAAGRFDAAARIFKQAHDVYPDPAYLFNIAVSYDEQKRFRLAVEYYGKFIKAVPKSPAIPEVTRRMNVAQAQLRAKSVQAVITTEPANLKTKVTSRSGEQTCTSPCELWVAAGPVAVEVSRGRRVVRNTYQAALGTGLSIRLEVPLVDEPSPIITRPEPPSTPDGLSGQQAAGWAFVGVGGASIITAAILGGLTIAANDEGLAIVAANDRSQAARLADLRDTVDTQSVVGDVLLGVGIGLALTGVVLVLTNPEAVTTESGTTVGFRF